MVRHATIDDIPQLLDLGETFYSCTKLAKYIPYDRESTAIFLNAILESDVSVMFVSEGVAGVRGAIAGMVTPAYWNRSKMMAQQLFLYQDSHGMAALELVRAWENWATIKQAVCILSGYKDATPKLGDTRRFLHNLHYEDLEHSCIKGVTPCP